MKTIWLASLLFLNTVGQAQNSKTSPNNTNLSICPPGMCLSANVVLNRFDLHKPRTNCSAGFGICIKIGFSVSCEYCTQKCYLEKENVVGWIKVSEGAAELHLPKALELENEFENTDMNFFEIADNMLSIVDENGVEKKIGGGLYTVVVQDDEYIIQLKLH